ncbi:MAG: hypothetical protein MUE95_15240 [Cyclobacteriaceae bacterium]|jgi:predicted esterase|nr:hypothetical protein [Cyclobacteriaceae bacterium]
MIEQHLTINFQARYYQSAPITPQTEKLLLVLHGYGQLARYFLKKFFVLDQYRICVVAPEGLSRFYLEPVASRAVTGNNRVGATWMTAEDRLTDIGNYLHYLDRVYQSVTANQHHLAVTVLGFSQGAATATRWVLHHPAIAQRLILWSGIFPNDMNFSEARERLADKQLVMVYGTNDPFINDQRLQEMTQLTERLGITPPVITFEGGHDIHPETLQQLI